MSHAVKCAYIPATFYPWVSNVVLQPAMLRTHRCFKLINWSYANQKHNSNWNTCVGPQHGRYRTTFETLNTNVPCEAQCYSGNQYICVMVVWQTAGRSEGSGKGRYLAPPPSHTWTFSLNDARLGTIKQECLVVKRKSKLPHRVEIG